MTIRLQQCAACGAHQYPARELCRVCLADALELADNDGRGRLLAETVLHRTLDPDFTSELPLRIGTVALDAGVRVIAFLAPGAAPGDAVVLRKEVRGEELRGAQPVFMAEKEQSA